MINYLFGAAMWQRFIRRNRRPRRPIPFRLRRRIAEIFLHGIEAGSNARQILTIQHGCIDDVNVPQDPILRGGSIRQIMRDRIPPWHRCSIGSQELPSFRPQFHFIPFLDRFPLNRRILFRIGQSLENFFTGHAEQKGLVGCTEVSAMAAPEANGVGVTVDGLNDPPGPIGGTVAALSHGLLVIVGHEEFVEVAAKPDRFGLVKELHMIENCLAAKSGICVLVCGSFCLVLLSSIFFFF